MLRRYGVSRRECAISGIESTSRGEAVFQRNPRWYYIGDQHHAYLVKKSAALIAGLLAQVAGAQTTLTVKVTSEAGDALPYSVVTVTPGSTVFTGEHGSYTFAAKASTLKLRVRHLGFTARDTTIDVSGRAFSIVVRLSPVALNLNTVSVRENSRCRPTPNNGTLAVVLEELTKNAEQEHLLRRQYPFRYRLHRVYDAYEPGFGLRKRQDDAWYGSTSTDRYTPGKILRSGVKGARRAGTEVWIPSLLDLADTVFLNRHCFSYKGVVNLEGTQVHQLDFEPDNSLINSIDYRGSAYLDSTTYVIRRAEFTLTNIELLHTSASSLEVITRYTELFPGVALFDRIRAVQRGSGAAYDNFEGAQIDDQRRIEVKFVKAPPGASRDQ